MGHVEAGSLEHANQSITTQYPPASGASQQAFNQHYTAYLRDYIPG